MKDKNRFWFYLLIIPIYFLVYTTSCTKDYHDPPLHISPILFNSDLTYGKVTDIDNNEYKTIAIGTQIWMAENLHTTRCNDGTPIPNVTDDSVWYDLTTPGSCVFNNRTDSNIISIYGRIYNGYAVSTDKLCPTGWHVPANSEWTILTTYLGGDSIAGGKLKETGTIHWNRPNYGATNETGFSALPGGYRDYDGFYNNYGDDGFWWSSTVDYTSVVFDVEMNVFGSFVGRGSGDKKFGFSVRCLKD
jgi:uncharacterized protein (TIGR02145 family)